MDRVGAVTVQVRTWEPDHEDAQGLNATEQTHDVVFENFAREATLEVGVWVDQWQDVGVLELKAQVQPAGDGRYLVGDIDTATMGIVDAQSATPSLPAITMSADQTSVAEGGTASFTLTRDGDSTQSLTVQRGGKTIRAKPPAGQSLGPTTSDSHHSGICGRLDQHYSVVERTRRPTRRARRAHIRRSAVFLRLPSGRSRLWIDGQH